VFVEYGVIDILGGHFPLLNGRGDPDVLGGIRRLGEGTILCIHGGERGGMASS
jgi:hypothetical protein